MSDVSPGISISRIGSGRQAENVEFTRIVLNRIIKAQLPNTPRITYSDKGGKLKYFFFPLVDARSIQFLAHERNQVYCISVFSPFPFFTSFLPSLRVAKAKSKVCKVCKVRVHKKVAFGSEIFCSAYPSTTVPQVTDS